MDGPMEIAPGVYGLGTKKVNWYLVEHEGRLTAVDAGLPRFAEDLDEELAKIGRATSEVDAVVLTHSDSDHTGIAPALQRAGARVLVHADDDATLRKPGAKGGDSNARNILPLLVKPAAWAMLWHMVRRGGAHPSAVQGAETYADGDVLDVPGSPRVLHTPGHTPGHCALWFEAHGALFVGDALCTWNPVGGVRGPQLMPRAFNVDTNQALSALSAIEDLEVDLLLPGHGDPWRDGAAQAVASARERAGA